MESNLNVYSGWRRHELLFLLDKSQPKWNYFGNVRVRFYRLVLITGEKKKKNKKEHNHFSAAIRVILRFNEAEYLKIAGM